MRQVRLFELQYRRILHPEQEKSRELLDVVNTVSSLNNYMLLKIKLLKIAETLVVTQPSPSIFTNPSPFPPDHVEARKT
jgi:hypothetical protein